MGRTRRFWIAVIVPVTFVAAGAGAFGQGAPLPEVAKVTTEGESIHNLLLVENSRYRRDGRFVLENGKVVEADLSGCSLDTITALKDLSLRKLNLANTCVWDLTPVQNQPIRSLNIWRAGAVDSAPILAMKDLEELRFGPDEYMRNMDALRRHPGIKRLAGNKDEPWLSPAEFWKKVDTWQYCSKEQQECAKETGRPVLQIIELAKGVKLHMALVPAGEFMRSKRKVKITKPFYVGQIAITQEQWRSVMGNNPSRFKGKERVAADWRPVETVSWNDIVRKFLPKLQQYAPEGATFRLPTEAQWEYACRSGTTSTFSFGKTISSEQANYRYNKRTYRGETTPGGMFPPNAWGLHDIHGNVNEWCEDWYDNGFYKNSPIEDPVNRTDWARGRVIRSSSWGTPTYHVQTRHRRKNLPDYQNGVLGFRICMNFGQGAPLPEVAKVTTEDENIRYLLLFENCRYRRDGRFVLENGKVVEADMSGCKLDTISALKDLSLRKLNLANTCVWDLTPVQNQPIKSLNIWRTGAVDSAPILAMKSLEELRFGPDEYMRDMKALRKHPSIKRLAGNEDEPWLSPTEFWKKVDAGQYYSEKQQECAKEIGRPVLQIIELPKGVKLHMTLVPAGEFMMGFGKKHKVKLTKPFYIGRLEVTQEQWQTVMGNNPSRFGSKYERRQSMMGGRLSRFKGKGKIKGADWRPVQRVSWNDIVGKFLPKLQQYAPEGATFRLPTEAQWEYACRSGTRTLFSFGKTISSNQANYNHDGSNTFRCGSTPGGMFPPNAWGLHDMHGNVEEWCEDWYDDNFYKNSPAEDPVNRKKSAKGERVIRSSTWDTPAYHTRSGWRKKNFPDYRKRLLGFRICLDFE